MKRYLSSFFITALLYFSLVGALLYYASSSDSSTKEPQIKSESRVKVSLLAMNTPETLKSLPKSKKVSKHCKTTPRTELKKRVLKKEILTQKELPKQKKRVVKKQKVVQKIEHKGVTQKIVKAALLSDEKERQRRALQKKVLQEREAQKRAESKKRAEELLLQKQNLFFTQLREAIHKNKSYPTTARRRNIQGDVKVKFFILASGDVRGIELLEGRSIFKRSVHEAIENSFPIVVEKSLFHFPKEFQLTLSYILK